MIDIQQLTSLISAFRVETETVGSTLQDIGETNDAVKMVVKNDTRDWHLMTHEDIVPVLEIRRNLAVIVSIIAMLCYESESTGGT